MKFSFKKSALATVLALSATSVMAASTLDIKVTGKIVPSSCTPTFGSGGGIADFGTMKVSSLNATTPTSLPDTKEVPITITCEEATRIGVTFTDARKSSAPTTKFDNVKFKYLGTEVVDYFGLGMYGDQKIGAYALGIDVRSGEITNAAGDTNLMAYVSTNGGVDWGTKDGDYTQILNTHNEIFSFGKRGTDAPEPQTRVDFKVDVEAIINPTNDLHITDEATLDGLTTVELVYL
ncbi:TPA: DUF1120 domain-containing protein [Salmonella enterica]|nr:DUF1120 domain-containing protein [Salmonella enterica]